MKKHTCICCHKRMKAAERIEIGWSAMWGAIACCSVKCVRKYNTKEC